MTARAAIVPPAWPALLNDAMAASYMTMAQSTFRAVAARNGVMPVELGVACTRWRRADLDHLIERLPLRDEQAVKPGADEPALKTVDELAGEALDRVRSRARRGR